MIELPRACTTADRIARHADFFSFGTNDLTQTALGFSRDDAESKFVPTYLDRKIIDRSPFETIDEHGVGWLVQLAAWLGSEAHQGLKLGVCGEHGGDPQSIEFFHRSGLDYVSCSPVPRSDRADRRGAGDDRARRVADRRRPRSGLPGRGRPVRPARIRLRATASLNVATTTGRTASRRSAGAACAPRLRSGRDDALAVRASRHPYAASIGRPLRASRALGKDRRQPLDRLLRSGGDHAELVPAESVRLTVRTRRRRRAWSPAARVRSHQRRARSCRCRS